MDSASLAILTVLVFVLGWVIWGLFDDTDDLFDDFWEDVDLEEDVDDDERDQSAKK